jgi:hypothetical protein
MQLELFVTFLLQKKCRYANTMVNTFDTLHKWIGCYHFCQTLTKSLIKRPVVDYGFTPSQSQQQQQQS